MPRPNNSPLIRTTRAVSENPRVEIMSATFVHAELGVHLAHRSATWEHNRATSSVVRSATQLCHVPVWRRSHLASTSVPFGSESCAGFPEAGNSGG